MIASTVIGRDERKKVWDELSSGSVHTHFKGVFEKYY